MLLMAFSMYLRSVDWKTYVEIQHWMKDTKPFQNREPIFKSGGLYMKITKIWISFPFWMTFAHQHEGE